jgi:hypothetical protein
MELARCGNCVYYMEDPKVCRRYPPTPMIVGMQQGLTQPRAIINCYFPSMDPNGWCGEHEASNVRTTTEG